MFTLRAWLFVVTIATLLSRFSTLSSEKKGVVHWHEEFNCTDFEVLNDMAWWYEYRPNINYLSESCPVTYDGFMNTYEPMVWDDRVNVDNVMVGSEYILGYNEPNHISQANMTPDEAVQAWADIESIANGRRLVSPSAAPCGSNCLGNRDEWFNSFFDKCKNRSPPCKIDVLATHTYWCNAKQVMRHLTNLSEEYQLPIWLTEFACGGDYSELDNINFMKDIMYRLENASFIYRYSWYKARISENHYVKKAASLLDPLGSPTLTKLGIYYNGFSGTEKVDGVWLSWGEWSNCGVSCGLGQMSRSRTCFYPDPLTTDLKCIGDDSETKECNQGACQVDGVWGTWSEWSVCGATCGEAQRSRSRECVFQDPANKGEDCSGESISYESCNLPDCPVDGVWGTWSEWSVCGATCGEAQRSRSRECVFQDPANKGQDCMGESISYESCNLPDCPVDGVWGTWSEWSICGATCGETQRSRSRECVFQDPANKGQDCSGESISYESCNLPDCPGVAYFGEWDSWSQCSASCGTGTRTRYRVCLISDVVTDVSDCSGEYIENMNCMGINCPVYRDCTWMEWSEWSLCSATCGKGTRIRERIYWYPSNVLNGNCSGSKTKSMPCNVVKC